MRVSLSDGDILTEKGDVLLFTAASEKGAAVVSPSMLAVDRECGGLVSAAIADGFRGAPGEIAVLHSPNFSFRRIVIAGCGDGDAAETSAAVGAAVEKVASLKDAKALTISCEEHAAAATTAVAAAMYRYRLGAANPIAPQWKSLRLHSRSRRISAAAVSRAAAIGEGARLTRHLAEQPGNICTPSFLAQTARKLARDFSSVQTTILDEKKIRELKMGALLAVAKGSAVSPKMIVMQYRGAIKGAPIALVGKGVTFDSGGISLKPGAAMDEMKFDMSGAAAMFGAILAAARMRLPLNVVAVVPACENMPGGEALKPGDVISAMNGKTIEVLNTDAEGRLILADALSYCAKFKPSAVVDAATLTGACVIALGRHFSGLFSSDNKLAAELQAAGEISGDGCWRMPLGDSYNRMLKTDYADMANIGGREAGAITAACFLSRFAECDSWAHLDVAGSAWNTKKRATGRPTPLLMQFLMRRAGWK